MTTDKHWPRGGAGGEIPTTEPPSQAGDWVWIASNGDGVPEWQLVDNLDFAAFNPTFNVTEEGGDFAGQSIVEKGYVIPTVRFTWASNDAVAFPMQDSQELKMDGNLIDLDGQPPGGNTGGSVSGGLYSDPGGMTESEHGPGFSVKLIDSHSTESVKNDVLYWRYRLFYLVSSQVTPDATWLGQVISGAISSTNNLRTTRAGSYTFSSGFPGYLYFVWPTSFGSGSFSTQFGSMDFDEFTINGVNNQYGESINWLISRSQQIQAASTSITVS